MISAISVNGNYTFVCTDTGRTVNLLKTHPSYDKVLELYNEDKLDMAQLDKLMNFTSAIRSKLTIQNNKVLYGNKVVKNSVANRILELRGNNERYDHVLLFLEKLMRNPSYKVIEQIYGFLEHNDITISQDGYIVAFKRVRSNYKDERTGTIDNSVGQVVEMPRNEVEDNPLNPCGPGLHFASRKFTGEPRRRSIPPLTGSRVVIVKIDPEDVVSIPVDHSQQKGRCCRYEVIGEVI